MSNPEQLLASPENNLEAIGEAARNRSEQLQNQETSVETSPESVERQVERARAEALEVAISVEAGGAEKDKKPATSAPRQKRSSPISREESFNRTMSDVQRELDDASRTFSKVIHNKNVEVASEAIGRTIARPRAIAAGSFMALVLTFALYMIAKFYGYQLSGFETIGAFIFGWCLGLIYDFLRNLITGKR